MDPQELREFLREISPKEFLEVLREGRRIKGYR